MINEKINVNKETKRKQILKKMKIIKFKDNFFKVNENVKKIR